MGIFESSLNNLLVDTFNSILKYEESSLKKMLGITVGEAHLIEAIGNSGGNATVSELATILDIATPTATVAIKKLESKGLATKVACAEDGRRYRVGLTREGERAFRTHRLFHKNMVKNISESFSEPEKSVLLNAIEKLSGYFKDKVPT